MSWSIAITLVCAVAYVQGHGRVVYPPHRGSLWRFGYDTPTNYDDDGLNCGGFYTQWSINDGKCGICGDAYDFSEPRPHELGGKYGQGYIVSGYAPGDIMSSTVYISAYHMGFWEFRICTDPYNTTQECFDENIIELEEGGTRYYPLKGSAHYEVNYRLPSDLVCDHCVLQWKYTAGNNWGVCANGTQGVGCGNQENFFTCSDIAIVGDVSYEKDTEAPPSRDIPAEVPILTLNGELLKLLMMTNEIQDVRPAYDVSSRKKYINRHKRKKTSKKAKRRRHKKILYRR